MIAMALEENQAMCFEHKCTVFKLLVLSK